MKLSYEYFHDERTADRGIPSFSGYPYAGATPNQYFGNPALSTAPATQNVAMAVVEHDFNNGLTVKNQTRFADYKRFYQNVYAGSAVSTAGTYTLAAYNNRNDRQNIVNQTGWVLFHGMRGEGSEVAARKHGDIEATAGAYLRRNRGNAVRALHEPISEWRNVVAACEQRSRAKNRVISQDCVRALLRNRCTGSAVFLVA